MGNQKNPNLLPVLKWVAVNLLLPVGLAWINRQKKVEKEAQNVDK